MSLGEARPAPIKDFAQLGVAFGIAPEPEVPRYNSIAEFAQLPIGKKIKRIQTGIQRKDPQLKTYKAMATYEVLHMDLCDQQAEGIQVVTVAPLTSDGQIAFQPFRSYGSFVIRKSTTRPFGFFQDKVMIDADRSHISRGNELGDAFTHDRLLLTEWMPETAYDRYGNLITSVKQVDRAIRKAKRRQVDVPKNVMHDILTQHRRSTAELQILNSVKDRFLVEYLQAAKEMQEQYPYLGRLSLLDSDSEGDNLHITLHMAMPLDNHHPERARNPQLMPAPSVERTVIHSTSINASVASQKREAALNGSQDPTDYVAWELCSLLGI